MLVLLPPSETKAPGGDGPPLELATLAFPELNPVRAKLVDALVELAGDVAASRAALGLSARQDGEIARNARLWSAPTLPALRRYTGVLYDALDLAGVDRARLARAERRLAVASALFGVVRGVDRIPGYRLSAGSALPAVGPLRTLWRPELEPALAAVDELVVDLRSGGYAALARIPGAVSVRVVTDDGHRRTTVSHHNKAHKGRLAAALATRSRQPSTVDGVVRAARAAGLAVDRVGERDLELVVPA
ncbi:hypothetical protein SAMN05421810_101202 [Amycolatopsis arida]|uniref:Peroxide stress protein YaaA n=1 Tax=Amycolatopsis arida TaxID=587909 RepID=A0A1I5KKY9_9PSEU|nr:peroxide stress protein YaaA [Amycolatopsis arida]TDX97098.1 hypothetical protein CLV69_102200 [Amycolatopsis arida]SFO85675.1 hypothetical protein SAMN05421810_101202 [Amycolatopsis arida]